MTRAINHKLEVAREEQRNREEIVEKQKIEVMAAKCRKYRRRISWFSGREENYEGDIGDDTDLN